MSYVTPCGLDLGSNNSVIAVIEEGAQTPTFIKTETGDTLHGAYVFYPESFTEKPIFGKEALAMLSTCHAGNVIRLVKRSLGVTAKQVEKTSVFNAEVKNIGKQRIIEFGLKIDGKMVVKSSTDVVTDFLRHYKNLVTNKVGERIAFVVSKPQNWNSNQNKAFHKALEGAGIHPLKVITEPTAATFAYRAKAGAEPKSTKILVTDLGAGTFDVVMLQDLGDGNFASVAVGGDDLLGASDVDEIFLEGLKTELQKEDGFNEKGFKDQLPEIREKMKELKHLLSTIPKVSAKFYGLTNQPHFTLNIDQTRKMEWLDSHYKRAEKAIRDTFERAAESSKGKFTAEALMTSVQVVALVGGGMRDPFYGNSLLPRLFPKASIVGKPNQQDSINPDEAVAIGSAFWAAALTKTATVQGLPEEPIHAQVLSKSLGVETVTNYGEEGMKRWFSKIITSNTAIPTIVKRGGFTTVKDNQEKVQIEVYQGEGSFTTEDGVLRIGKYDVPIKSPNKVNEPRIEVEMEVTEDNILIVHAGEKDGPKKKMEIVDV